MQQHGGVCSVLLVPGCWEEGLLQGWCLVDGSPLVAG